MTAPLIKSTRLATLDEIYFLLNRIRMEENTITKQLLSTVCKHHSLHLIFSFESTLHFLETIGIIDSGVSGNMKLHSSNKNLLTSRKNLSIGLFQATMSYLNKVENLRQLFTPDVITFRQGTLYIQTLPINATAPFLKLILLHLQIAEQSERDITLLSIKADYIPFFNPYFDNNHIPRPKNIFVSYSSKDEIYLKELRQHFKTMRDNNEINYFDGGMIAPGDLWDEKIKQHLQQADIIILLISVDFINSGYINDIELKQAIEKHSRNECKIIPIVARECDFENAGIGKFQAIRYNNKSLQNCGEDRDNAYKYIIAKIREGIKNLKPSHKINPVNTF